MIVFRGVNTYPAHIDQILSSISESPLECGEIGCEYKILLDRMDDGRESFELSVERGMGAVAKDDAELVRIIKNTIKKEIMITVDVKIVEHGDLPRTAVGKLRRVEDKRYL
jgi:phenylacetate-CoA ligase